MIRTVHVSIAGYVQGVGYRAWTVKAANRRGLSGWVRNRRDGSVEAVFSGDAALIDEMLEACRSGPPAAAVESVTIEDQPGEHPEPGFRALTTI